MFPDVCLQSTAISNLITLMLATCILRRLYQNPRIWMGHLSITRGHWNRNALARWRRSQISQSSCLAALRRERVHSTRRLVVSFVPSWRIRTASPFTGTTVCSKYLAFPGQSGTHQNETENCPLPSKSSGYDIVRKISAKAHVYGDVTSFKAYADLKGMTNKHRTQLHCAGVSLIDCPHNGMKDVVDNTLIGAVLVVASLFSLLMLFSRHAVLRYRPSRPLHDCPHLGRPRLHICALRFAAQAVSRYRYWFTTNPFQSHFIGVSIRGLENRHSGQGDAGMRDFIVHERGQRKDGQRRRGWRYRLIAS
jgi:hypothetical protein